MGEGFVTLSLMSRSFLSPAGCPSCFIRVHDVEGSIHNSHSVGQSASQLLDRFDSCGNDRIYRWCI